MGYGSEKLTLSNCCSFYFAIVETPMTTTKNQSEQISKDFQKYITNFPNFLKQKRTKQNKSSRKLVIMLSFETPDWHPGSISHTVYFHSNINMFFPKTAVPIIGLKQFVYPSIRVHTRHIIHRSASSYARPVHLPFGLRPLQLIQYKKYSTSSSAPPPPPPPKNAKGFEILSKISRVATFSISSIMVVGALGVSGLVIYLMFSELFLPSGETKTFNKALKVIESSEVAQKALEFPKGERLKAHGEVAGDKWVRNRPIQSARKKGPDGKDHMVLRFHVESNAGKHATVMVEQIDTSFWTSEFAYIALDVYNGKRVYVVEPKFSSKNIIPRGNGIASGNGFLGLSWGPKKD